MGKHPMLKAEQLGRRVLPLMQKARKHRPQDTLLMPKVFTLKRTIKPLMQKATSRKQGAHKPTQKDLNPEPVDQALMQKGTKLMLVETDRTQKGDNITQTNSYMVIMILVLVQLLLISKPMKKTRAFIFYLPPMGDVLMQRGEELGRME